MQTAEYAMWPWHHEYANWHITALHWKRLATLATCFI